MDSIETTNITLTGDDSWTLVASLPSAITIKSNGGHDWNWHVCVTPTNVAPIINGEIHPGGHSWVAGSITGYVWIKTYWEQEFAITM